MSIDKLLNDTEVSELKQKNDLINVLTLTSMWAQVILAFGIFIFSKTLLLKKNCLY